MRPEEAQRRPVSDKISYFDLPQGSANRPIRINARDKDVFRRGRGIVDSGNDLPVERLLAATGLR
jgi:hypothetical protein